jgi:hypothetical protein
MDGGRMMIKNDVIEAISESKNNIDNFGGKIAAVVKSIETKLNNMPSSGDQEVASQIGNTIELDTHLRNILGTIQVLQSLMETADIFARGVETL